MKTIIVGDLHGQFEIVDKVLALGMPTVFLGDYLDSFSRSVEDQVTTLIKVLTACQERDDVDALFGNHELNYLDSYMRCSGYKSATRAHINLLQGLMYDTLETHIFKEGFLLSHAGVSQRLLGDDISLQDYLDEGDYRQIGAARGGMSPIGGLYWCDWDMEFEPVEDTPQIVGHTRGKGIRQNGNSYCVDCLEDGDEKFLVIDDGEAVEWDDI